MDVECRICAEVSNSGDPDDIDWDMADERDHADWARAAVALDLSPDRAAPGGVSVEVAS